MKAFVRETGIAVPLDAANVDTDQIIPKQFLKSVTKIGFGKHLFHDWRYLDDAENEPNPEFVLNEKRYEGAKFLLARENFGNGSSREHAPGPLPTTASGQSSPRASRTSSTTTRSTTASSA